MSKTTIKSEKLKIASGPFSWGIRAGSFVFLSGMVGIDAKGGLIGKDDIKLQTRQSLENIKSALESVGGKPNNIIKLTSFLRDLNDYAKFNEARVEFFKENAISQDFPASTAVQAHLIRDDFLVEVEAIAYME